MGGDPRAGLRGLIAYSVYALCECVCAVCVRMFGCVCALTPLCSTWQGEPWSRRGPPLTWDKGVLLLSANRALDLNKKWLPWFPNSSIIFI